MSPLKPGPKGAGYSVGSDEADFPHVELDIGTPLPAPQARLEEERDPGASPHPGKEIALTERDGATHGGVLPHVTREMPACVAEDARLADDIHVLENEHGLGVPVPVRREVRELLERGGGEIRKAHAAIHLDFADHRGRLDGDGAVEPRLELVDARELDLEPRRHGVPAEGKERPAAFLESRAEVDSRDGARGSPGPIPVDDEEHRGAMELLGDPACDDADHPRVPPLGGQHHMCFEVPDIHAAKAEFEAKDARVLGEPRIGAHGTLVFFVHPKDMGGVLTEIMESPKQAH